ncbi:MAG: methyltransferase domain-containing protein [Burkholderiales bacterium]
MRSESQNEINYLGQFIPVHYHHNMLMDANRMKSFKTAIDYAVFPGAKVLELGGGTGVLSWFAAARAEKVWCVEFNPEMVREAKRFLSCNPNGEKVAVLHADAFEYLPPEPVDVVICEMIHVAMLREKQVDVIEGFKRRYLQRFGGPLPRFIPEAVVMAVQPVQQDFNFEGFYAPIVQFQETSMQRPKTVSMADPVVYAMLDFSVAVAPEISWCGTLRVKRAGTVNALRFITKNILAVVKESGSTINWLNHYMVLPLDAPALLRKGEEIDIAFEYRAGAQIPSLQSALQVTRHAIRRQASH